MTLALVRLLQLASPALPVGAYTYSQGLEWVVEAGTVRDEATALCWIADLLEWNLARFEAPLLAQMMVAWSRGAHEQVRALDARYLASRETAELRAETLQMGYSLRRLLRELDEWPPAFLEALDALPAPTLAVAWSGVAAHWTIAPQDALTAWLWSWAENQTLAALKIVPLGQTAGQRMLLRIGERIPAIVQQALAWPDHAFSNFAPGFALACTHHETQYSRLFRS